MCLLTLLLHPCWIKWLMSLKKNLLNSSIVYQTHEIQSDDGPLLSCLNVFHSEGCEWLQVLSNNRDGGDWTRSGSVSGVRVLWAASRPPGDLHTAVTHKLGAFLGPALSRGPGAQNAATAQTLNLGLEPKPSPKLHSRLTLHSCKDHRLT